MEGHKYDSITVAKYIVAKANEKNIPVNITKVQKLLYIAYGIYLAVKESRLTDEHPQAWPYGPVFPRTRKALLKYPFLSAIALKDETFSTIRKDNEVNSLLDLVFKKFGDWSAQKLSEWSHQDNSPWDRTTQEDGFKWGDQIVDGFIAPFFKGMLTLKSE